MSTSILSASTIYTTTSALAAPTIYTTTRPASFRINDSAAEEFWGAPIHVYTREQAIADGLLVDATVGDLAPVSRQHFGEAHVAMTAALFALIQRAVENPKSWNDWRGVWHDICWMSIVLPECKLDAGLQITTWFKVIITGAGRKRYHQLKRVMTPDGAGGVDITFMLADED